MSADERKAERRALLLEAGLEVIGTRGWSQTTVRDVCQQAGLTERYFYEAFDDRAGLLHEVYGQVRAETVAAVLSAFGATPGGPRRKARAAIAAAFTVLADDPRKGRVLILEGQNDERLQQRRQEDMIANADLLARLAVDYLGETAFDADDAALTSLALVGAVSEVGTAFLAGRLPVSRERVIDHLTDHFLSVLPRPHS
ncbi:MAG: TetR/AcrR family transcriptional regulator [Polyangiales bacterium]|nr:TetR/AcrR family transcriptional regulator [Myxococcales bacterium]MCB9660921.1 TetR/AcrR family transcriptional regulator [Sandaracinaceae bacterium]